MDRELHEYLASEIRERLEEAKCWENIMTAMGVTLVDIDGEGKQ